MGRFFLPMTVCMLPLFVAGCRTNPRTDLIEAELRTKDQELRQIKGRVQSLELMNQSLEGELLRRNGVSPQSPYVSSSLVGPKEIVLAAGTGGVRDPGSGLGDDHLQVVVLPKDEDGNPVRALGSLVVYAFEIQPGGTKTPLCGWELGTEELRRTWSAGLISKGYHVVLAWKRIPTQEKMRVMTQLRLPDGRILEAEKDITIRPPKGLAPIAPVVPSGPPPIDPIPPLESGPSISQRAAQLLPPRSANDPD